MPEKYRTRVLVKKKLKGNYWWISLEKPAGFEYKAGQYVSLLVDRETGMRRSYSLASFPAEQALDLMVDTTPMGVGSKYILELNEGDEVEILGSLGRFVISGTSKHKVFMGTGSGIVPLRSMVWDLLETKNFMGRVELNWGMRHVEDAFWKEEFEELMRKYANFHFDLVLSQPLEGWLGCKGHVQDCLLTHHKVNLSEWEAYVCGNTKMAEDVEAKLIAQGVAKENVFRENFG